MKRTLGLLFTVVLAVSPVCAQTAAEARNMVLVGYNDLNGNGDGGEGLAIQQWPDGRRLLYFAHVAEKVCISIIDVTHPDHPVLVNQLPSPSPGITRCNSLGLSGNVLAVANQTLQKGQKTAGLWVLDVSNFSRIQRARSLADLKLSFVDTSGPNSRGAHAVWFVDGEFAHVTTGMPDFDTPGPLDDQLYLTLDLRDPRHPREVGRWWLPGTRKGDACLPECKPPRNPKYDGGYRPHNIEVWPDHPGRAYMAYLEGGVMVLDISGLADVKAGRAQTFTPKVLSHVGWAPPFAGYTHTFQPFFNRGLALVADEAITPNCKTAPETLWLMDIHAEKNPVILGSAPFHPNDGELCSHPGLFGMHNLHPNLPSPTSARLKNTAVSAWFDGGVRIYRVVDDPSKVPDAPPHLEEIAYYVPATPANSPLGSIQINHVLVDEKGFIYACDRITGGLYILRYTGSAPLD